MKSLSLSSLVFIFSAIFAQAETREWTSSDGRKLKATILDFDGSVVSLETSRGKFELPLSKLSTQDREYAKTWAKEKEEKTAASGKKIATTLGNFDDLKLGAWPQSVEANLATDQISKIEEDESQYIYRTPHFEFHSPDRLSTSVVREFARIFEATFAFVDQMPIGLAPKNSSNGLYLTKLYMTASAYFNDGGVPGSAGMFSLRRRGNEMSGRISIPLPNLGVEYTGTRFIVDHKKRSDTLTHEIVHQVMIRWLGSGMPVWLSEGIAEVVSSQSYSNGRFKLNSMNRSIAEKVTRGRGRDFRMVKLEKLMTITNREWADELSRGGGGINYNSANVLAYYFLRLEGDGDGAHLVDFLKDLASSKRNFDKERSQNTYLLRERSYEELEDDLASAWRSEGLKITF